MILKRPAPKRLNQLRLADPAAIGLISLARSLPETRARAASPVYSGLPVNRDRENARRRRQAARRVERLNATR
jgi:hypothetical protein